MSYSVFSKVHEIYKNLKIAMEIAGVEPQTQLSEHAYVTCIHYHHILHC